MAWDAEMIALAHSPLNSELGMTLDEVVSHCDNTTGSFGRFQAWLGGDTAKIKEVLTAVQNAGMSPAFFASYEASENVGYYNGIQLGWLNYTYPQGDPVQDATAVAQHMVSVSNDSSRHPSWIDDGNKVDFVPQADKDAGNADFANMPLGTIGHAYIPSTAAATWEVYYPNGLLVEYNKVQNYGHPFTDAIRILKSWGGKITDGGSTTPVKPNKPAPSKPSTTPKPKPSVNTAPIKPVYHGAYMSHELGGSNRGFTNLNFEFFNNKKKADKPSNDTKPSNDNHNQDVDQGNKDKPKPSKPNEKLDLSWLDSIHGQQVGGDEQCYSLARAWAQHNGVTDPMTKSTASRQPGIKVAEENVEVGMGACNIGCEFPWASWGWEVIVNPTIDQIQAGDICCMVCDGVGGWIPPYQGVNYGHVCIAGTNSGGVFSLWEQNGTAKFAPNYNTGVAKQPQDNGKPDFAKNYIQLCFYAIRKK